MNNAPRLYEWIVRRVAPPGVAREGILGDLHEEYKRRAESDRAAATRWYRKQALNVVRTYGPVRVTKSMRAAAGSLSRFLRVEQLAQEISQSARRLRQSSGFAVLAVLTLALGVGANAAVFSVLNGVVIKPLPYDDSHNLISVKHTAPGLDMTDIDMSSGLFDIYRQGGSLFAGFGMHSRSSANITGLETPVRALVSEVVGTFDVLRAAPLMGRLFVEADHAAGAEKVAVTSYRFWRDILNRDPDVIGSSLVIHGLSHEVVGVLPEGFVFPDPELEVWTARSMDPQRLVVTAFDADAIFRLNDGVTLEAARDDLRRLIPIASERFPQQAPPAIMERARIDLVLSPLKSAVIGDTAATLWILLASVGAVLLIAAANVANFFLVRSESRVREIAVRTSLGARGADIVRLFVAESMLVAIAGGVVGLIFAMGSIKVFLALEPVGIPRSGEIGVDPTVTLFIILISLAAGILLGLLPAFRMRSPSLAGTLREGGRTATSGRERHVLRNSLATAQVALAVVLLVGSGLLLKSYVLLTAVDPGFDPENVLTLQVSMPGQEYPGGQERYGYLRQVRDAIEEVPGVTRAGSISILPMDGINQLGFWVAGSQSELPNVFENRRVVPGYFETMDIQVLAGRSFDESDAQSQTRAVVVNETLARRFWDTAADAIGKELHIRNPDAELSTIVGVVADVRVTDLKTTALPVMYLPLAQWSWASNSVVVKTSEPPLSLVAPIRDVLSRIDANIPIARIRTMDDVVAQSTARDSFTALMLTVAAGIALFLGRNRGLWCDRVHLLATDLGDGCPHGPGCGSLACHVHGTWPGRTSGRVRRDRWRSRRRGWGALVGGDAFRC